MSTQCADVPTAVDAFVLEARQELAREIEAIRPATELHYVDTEAGNKVFRPFSAEVRIEPNHLGEICLRWRSYSSLEAIPATVATSHTDLPMFPEHDPLAEGRWIRAQLRKIVPATQHAPLVSPIKTDRLVVLIERAFVLDGDEKSRRVQADIFWPLVTKQIELFELLARRDTVLAKLDHRH